MQDGNEVAIFWDFPSCPAPLDRSGYAVANNLRVIAQKFGSVKYFKAYLAISEHSKACGDRIASEVRYQLQVSGVSLTDVPASTQNSAAEQMITVDMLVYALDRSPLTTTILLVTDDPEFAYAISTLRLRNYRVVVISSSDGHPSLASQASIHFEWALDVLEMPNVPLSTSGDAPKTTLKKPSPPKPQVQPASAPSKVILPLSEKRNSIGYDFGDVPLPTQNTPRVPSRDQLDEVGLENFLPQKGQSRASGTETPDERLSPRFRSSIPSLHGGPPFNIPSDLDIHTSSKPSSSKEPSWPNFGRPDQSDEPSVPTTPRLASIARRTPNNTNQPKTYDPFGDYTSPKPSYPQSLPSATSPPHGLSPSAGVFQPTLVDLGQRPTPGHFMSPRAASTSGLPPIAKPFQPPQPVNGSTVFQPLVEALRAHRSKGSYTPLRSSIALELVQQDKDVYKKAGVEKFAPYSALAEKEGVIKLGGKNGGAWIQLQPAWY